MAMNCSSIKPSVNWLDGVQTGLDAIGLIPVFGEAADLANAGISLGRGDFLGAGLSAVSMVPIVGDVIGKGGKVARKVVRIAPVRKVAAKELHHIVEQRNILRRGWSKAAIHSSDNICKLPKGFHREISKFYSSKQYWLTGPGYSTMRQWMNTKGFDEQYKLGYAIMEYLKTGVWPTDVWKL